MKQYSLQNGDDVKELAQHFGHELLARTAYRLADDLDKELSISVQECLDAQPQIDPVFVAFLNSIKDGIVDYIVKHKQMELANVKKS